MEGERTQEVGRERGEKESERRKGGEREEGEEGEGVRMAGDMEGTSVR